MTQNTGVTVPGEIRTADDQDQYPIVDERGIRGGFATVDTFAALSTVPVPRRRSGMIRKVRTGAEAGRHYELQTDLVTWTDVSPRTGPGGWVECATITARNALPTNVRRAGMAAYVVSENKLYTLGTNLTTWTEFAAGGAPSDGNGAIYQLVIPSGADAGVVITDLMDEIADGAITTSRRVVVAAPPGESITINTNALISASQVTLDFASPVVFGAEGGISIFGRVQEVPESLQPRQTGATTPAGSSTMLVSIPSGQPFRLANGDYVKIRGNRSLSGDARTREDNRVLTVVPSGGNFLVTFVQPLDNTYLTTWPDADPLNNRTEISKVVAAELDATTAVRGSSAIRISDPDNVSLFQPGAYVQILDDGVTTYDRETDGSPGGFSRSNWLRREQARVFGVVDDMLILDHPLHHTYQSGQGARVALMVPVINSHVLNAKATWSVQSTVNTAFSIALSVECSMRHCKAIGGLFSWRSQAFRHDEDYLCAYLDCEAIDPVDVITGGAGYGSTFYGSTHCLVEQFHAGSNRHSVLFFNGAAGNICRSSRSTDCAVSDYDLHGGNSVDNLITGCVATGGTRFGNTSRRAACRAGNTSHSNGDHNNVFDRMVVINYNGEAFNVVRPSSRIGLINSIVWEAENAVNIEADRDSPISPYLDDIYIEGNEFRRLRENPLIIDGSDTASAFDPAVEYAIRRLRICGNKFDAPVNSLELKDIAGLTFDDNEVINPDYTSGWLYTFEGRRITGLKARGNKFNNLRRGFLVQNCPGHLILRNHLDELNDATPGARFAYYDDGGNNNGVFQDNSLYGYTPVYGAGGSPSTGLNRQSLTGSTGGGVGGFDPAIVGLKAANLDPAYCSTSGSLLTGGTRYLARLDPVRTVLVDKVCIYVMTAGVSLTTSLVAIYDAAGNRIATSAEQGAAWESTGLKQVALTSAVTLVAGEFYYVAVLSAGGTLPALARSQQTNSGFIALAAANNSLRWAVNGTAQTTMPTTLTLSGNSGTGAALWVGAN